MISAAPKISAMIPPHNGMATMPQVLESVLNEANKENIEIVSGNDGIDEVASGLAS
jgi:hypothetical protein